MRIAGLTVLTALFVACLLLTGCGATHSNASASTSSSGGNGGSGGSGGGSGGSGGGSSSSPTFLYVSETRQDANAAQSGVLEVFSFDKSSGALKPISGSPFSTQSSTAGDLALSPKNTDAYLLGQQYGTGCCVGPFDLQVFALDPSTGTPSLKQSLPAGSSAFASLTEHPSGNFLYVTPWNSDQTTGTGIFTVGSDGSVTYSSTANTNGGGSPAITPNGKFFYTDVDAGPVGNWFNTQACGPVTTDVYQYSVEPSTGNLTPLANNPLTFQRNECEVGHESTNLLKAVDTSGQRLFMVDEANANLLVFPIDQSTGELSQPQTIAVNGFSSVAMDPVDPFLYIGGVLEFTGYQVSGSPAPIPGMPMSITPVPADNETGSTTMAIDPSGAYLFSNENGYTSAFSCCDADGLVGFKIDPKTGALTQFSPPVSTLAGSASKIVFTH
jgi:hypothetical protein